MVSLTASSPSNGRRKNGGVVVLRLIEKLSQAAADILSSIPSSINSAGYCTPAHCRARPCTLNYLITSAAGTGGGAMVS